MELPLIYGIGVGLLALFLTFKIFFEDFGDFCECIGYWFTPDSWSFMKGEHVEDFFAELKLGLWMAIGGGAGYFTYHHFLTSSVT